ncbi:hypothetical protein SAMN05216255_3612 [Pseudomonas segetis]|uniref:Uncharacterized protein n=2 Tax=Pseudomonas segetis TaxID=298908 RepID=A0A239HWJ5_9PSED|nr:hypothetical protein SAMN05216255_3612 [Pseudomonas segetis]
MKKALNDRLFTCVMERVPTRSTKRLASSEKLMQQMQLAAMADRASGDFDIAPLKEERLQVINNCFWPKADTSDGLLSAKSGHRVSTRIFAIH